GFLLATPSNGDTSSRADFVDQLDTGWMQNDYWFDGTAEINQYASTRIMYGTPRPTDETAHIIVTEKHDPELLVKADDWRRPGLLDVVKFNYVTSARTGVYTYHQMFSFFFAQSDLRLAKMTLASHEWCGNTFKELVNVEGRESYDFNTYWDGQGNGSHDVDFPDGLVVYDSLPVQLRALPWRLGLRTELDLLPSQLSSKAPRPRWSRATLEVTAEETIEVEAGRFTTWVVELEHDRGTDRLWFETAFPHRMIRWEAASGDTHALRASTKMPYWQFNQPSDEQRLP
ncbi:MAG: hypothetical protein AAGD38_17100, partial [Acidobacteriota bacterium]